MHPRFSPSTATPSFHCLRLGIILLDGIQQYTALLAVLDGTNVERRHLQSQLVIHWFLLQFIKQHNTITHHNNNTNTCLFSYLCLQSEHELFEVGFLEHSVPLRHTCFTRFLHHVHLIRGVTIQQQRGVSVKQGNPF